jgi:putative addiction module killer protein
VEARPQELIIFEHSNGECPYSKWLKKLDRRIAKRITLRVGRLEEGNFGDCKAARDGVQELRLDFGPGYRVYFAREGKAVVVLLFGGDKSSQTNDIKAAKAFWREYER